MTPSQALLRLVYGPTKYYTLIIIQPDSPINKKNSKKNSSKDKKSFITKLSKGLSGIQGEFKRIVWPSRQTILKETTTVIFTSLLVGTIIVAMDFVYNAGFNAFVELLK